MENLIEALVDMWHEWMHNHKIVNDVSYSALTRRQAGLRCEELQELRQDLIREIDDIVESEWMKCE